MLKKIENLPATIVGIRAEGKVTGRDYELLAQMLEERSRSGEKVRFLYYLGPEFGGFTPAAAWDDFRIGMKYLRLFERCAIVTDVRWIRDATHLFGSLMPCPVKTFGAGELDGAVAWLGSVELQSHLEHELTADGILVIRPEGALRREDFEQLAGVADPWIEARGALRGVVVEVRQFPGWENLGSLIRHIRFVREHHRRVRRVALVTDMAMSGVMSALTSQFVAAELKRFPAGQRSEAVAWIREAPETRAAPPPG